MFQSPFDRRELDTSVGRFDLLHDDPSSWAKKRPSEPLLREPEQMHSIRAENTAHQAGGWFNGPLGGEMHRKPAEACVLSGSLGLFQVDLWSQMPLELGSQIGQPGRGAMHGLPAAINKLCGRYDLANDGETFGDLEG